MNTVLPCKNDWARRDWRVQVCKSYSESKVIVLTVKPPKFQQKVALNVYLYLPKRCVEHHYAAKCLQIAVLSDEEMVSFDGVAHKEYRISLNKHAGCGGRKRTLNPVGF